MSQVTLDCAKYLQLSDSGWHKSEILTHDATRVFRVFLKTLSPVTYPANTERFRDVPILSRMGPVVGGTLRTSHRHLQNITDFVRGDKPNKVFENLFNAVIVSF